MWAEGDIDWDWQIGTVVEGQQVSFKFLWLFKPLQVRQDQCSGDGFEMKVRSTFSHASIPWKELKPSRAGDGGFPAGVVLDC